MMERDGAVPALSFGEALAEVEHIVGRLESDGDLELEEALALYESGLALIARCRQSLAAAELKLTEVPPTSEE